MSNGGDSLEKLRALQITSLEDEEDDKAQVNGGGDIIDDDDDDDDDDDEEEEEQVQVTLGFVEKPKNRWSLLRQLFPSKAGGVPAWLNPINLPSGRSCQCDICGQPLHFLLQVMHHWLKRNLHFIVHYLYLCVLQWLVFYKININNGNANQRRHLEVAMKTQWPEYEIINEDESELDIEISEDNRYANSLVSAGSQMDEAMKSLLDNFEGDGDRKSWASFQECISRAPDQVLRYCRI